MVVILGSWDLFFLYYYFDQNIFKHESSGFQIWNDSLFQCFIMERSQYESPDIQTMNQKRKMALALAVINK
jgi:hypothetical protein